MRIPGLGIDLGDALGTVRDELSLIKDRALGSHLRVAITGLKHSGKTVFTTAIVHHLLEPADLPFLEAVHESRYLGAQLVGTERAASFPFSQVHKKLTARPPEWPRPTERLTTLQTEIAFRTRSLV